MASVRTPPPQPSAALEALRLILPQEVFSEQMLRELLPRSTVRELPENTVLIREGDPAEQRVYFLLQGSVSVSIQDRFILRLQNPGDSIGEMGLISASPRSATVTTDGPARVLVLDASLETLQEGDHDYKLRYYLSRIFNTILTEKLRTTSDRARLYEDMVNHSRTVEHQRLTLESEIAAHLQQISLYSHLVNSANDAILITDPAGLILNANRALARRFGIESETVIGVEVGILLALPIIGPERWEAVSAVARKGGWHGEVTLYHGELGATPADCSISVVQQEKQAILAYSVILRDIRERRALEVKTRRQAEELERAYGQLRELDQAKSRFLNLISHELRTPVSSILAYSELLLTEGMVEPDDQGSYLEVIHAESRKLTEMVNKVLAISKLESGQMLFQFAEAKLEQPVRAAVDALHDRAQAKALAVEVRVPAPLQPVVFDAENLREAVAQLLDNAIAFTEAGTIRIDVTQRDGQSLIRVVDPGKGIVGLDLDSLLETFGRGETDNVGGHGLGLGLPLCYLIVKAHSGALSLRSHGGHGTEAIISLPMQTRDLETNH